MAEYSDVVCDSRSLSSPYDESVSPRDSSTGIVGLLGAAIERAVSVGKYEVLTAARKPLLISRRNTPLTRMCHGSRSVAKRTPWPQRRHVAPIRGPFGTTLVSVKNSCRHEPQRGVRYTIQVVSADAIDLQPCLFQCASSAAAPLRTY